MTAVAGLHLSDLVAVHYIRLKKAGACPCFMMNIFLFIQCMVTRRFLPEERLQEREFALMKSFYPETARKIQNIVETECEILDYEGSRLS